MTHELQALALAATAFDAFGIVVDAAAKAPEAINEATTLRHSDLATLDLLASGRDPVLAIYVARARKFPLRIEKLERHREAAQVFLPLGTHRFVVVVASGGDTPDWEHVKAFITAPGQGVIVKRGCWHHGLIALGDGDRFAVIEGANYRRDNAEAIAPRALEVVLG